MIMALLHDIGKIGIPDAILNKPGRVIDENGTIDVESLYKKSNEDR